MQELVDDHILGSGRRSFVVEQGKNVVGLLTLHNLREVPQTEWSTTTAAQVMIPTTQLKRIQPDTHLWTAVEEMDRDGANQLPVMSDGHMSRMLTRDGIISFLRTVEEVGT